MNTSEIILEVGAEGATQTLYGRVTTAGWLFFQRVIDETPELPEKLWIDSISEVVNTWPEALELLDRYPWQHLNPLQVHPGFREAVHEAACARLDPADERMSRLLARWSRICEVDGV